MIRILLGATALVGALVALLMYISGPANERLEKQNDIASGKTSGLGKRGSSDKGSTVATGRPRKAGHVLVKIVFPADDARAVRGGRIIATLHGNGVAYRRKGLDDASLERHRVALRAVDGLLAAADQLPAKAAGARFYVVIDLGEGTDTRQATADDVERILGLMQGKSERWVPGSVEIQCAGVPDAPTAGLPTWPELPLLKPPHGYENPEPFQAPSANMKLLIDVLTKGERFIFEDDVYRVVSWKPTRPS